MMGWSPPCHIPSFVEIGQPVPKKKIFEGYVVYSTVDLVCYCTNIDAFSKISFCFRLLFICEEVHWFSGKMLIVDCLFLLIFLYFEEDESIRLDNTNYNWSVSLKMLSVY